MVFSKHLYMVILSYILLIIAVAGAGIALVITHTALILGSLLFIFSLSSTIKTGFCQRHPQEKKNAIETQRFHSVLSAYSVLVIVFFDFRYFLCRSRNDTQTVIAHAVKQSIKLPPLRVLLRRRF